MPNSEPNSNSPEDIVASYGTSLTDPTKSLTLYLNRQRAIEGRKQDEHSMRLLLYSILAPIVLSAVISYFLFSYFVSQQIALILCFPLLILALLLIVVHFSTVTNTKNDYLNSLESVMQIRPDGLSINCPSRKFDSIPWESIKEVKSYSFVFKNEFPLMWFFPTWTYLCIVPYNFDEVMKFNEEEASRARTGTRISEEEAREIYLGLRKNWFWKYLVPEITETENSIDIREDLLPLNANEIAAYINIRRKQFSKSTDSE